MKEFEKEYINARRKSLQEEINDFENLMWSSNLNGNGDGFLHYIEEEYRLEKLKEDRNSKINELLGIVEIGDVEVPIKDLYNEKKDKIYEEPFYKKKLGYKKYNNK
jgi:hypothetical protein